MIKKTTIYFIIDLLILFVNFVILSKLSTGHFTFILVEHKLLVISFLFVWVLSSLLFRKYRFFKAEHFKGIVSSLIFSSTFTFVLVLSFIIFSKTDNYLRFFLIGTISITTLFEFIWSVLIYWVKFASPDVQINLNKYSNTYWDIKKYNTIKEHDKYKIDYKKLSALISDFGIEPINYMLNFVDLNSEKTLLLQTNSNINAKLQIQDKYHAVVNFCQVNNIGDINMFFESINNKLESGSIFIGVFETKNLRKKRLLNKFPPIINYIYYSFDFIIKRILPKLNITKGLYYLLTQNKNHVLSIAETFGRLYSCGFALLDNTVLVGKQYFVVVKITEPFFPKNTTYGPLIKLKRIAWKGNKINVYKLRTMHPYSEFIQAYIYKKNGLLNGDKAIDDIRVTSWGRFLRKFWIDEIPMIYNLIKGEIKLVGVRPLSETKFKMYPKELQEKRILFKPGLIPPFYVDMPQSFEEHLETENKYLDLYAKHPIKTDFKYFYRAMINILFRNARSQ